MWLWRWRARERRSPPSTSTSGSGAFRGQLQNRAGWRERGGKDMAMPHIRAFERSSSDFA